MSAFFDRFAFGDGVGCADGLNGYGAARRAAAGSISLHKQRKVTCPRRGSRPKAFGIAAGDSTTYFGAQDAPYARWSAASGTIAFKRPRSGHQKMSIGGLRAAR